jgi:hypothetical protein
MKKLSIKKLRMLIEQEVDHDLAHEHPSEIEPIEDAFAGGENLVQPVEYSNLGGAFDEEDHPKAPEILSLIDDAGVITVSEARLRSIVRSLLIKSN